MYKLVKLKDRILLSVTAFGSVATSDVEDMIVSVRLTTISEL